MSQSTQNLIESLKNDLPNGKRPHSIWLQLIFWVSTSLIFIILNFKFFHLQVRKDIMDENPIIWGEIVFLSITIVFSSFSALLLSRPDRGQNFKWVPTISIAGWALLFIFSISQGPDFFYQGSFLNYLMAPCLKSILLLGAFPAALLFGLVRWGATTQWATTSALTALAGSALGFLVIRVECPYQEPYHLLFTHLLPAAIVISFGIAAGKRMLRW